MEYEKVYVEMLLQILRDGTVRPLKMKWKDGHFYDIDRVTQRTRAASLKVGGCGIRYTCMIEGKERYIFDEDGKWYVEARPQ